MARMDKINQLMKREISNIIQQEFQDPRLMFVTIISVDVSPDLRNAIINYSVLGDDKQIQAVSKTLSSLSGYIRKLIGQRIRLRYTPKISFVYDKSIEYSIRIEKTLNELKDQRMSQSKKKSS